MGTIERLKDRTQIAPATMDDDLYDEFGNFIGEEAEVSEEESEHGVDVGNYAYDDNYPEAAPEAPADEHMDVDGMHWLRSNAATGR